MGGVACAPCSEHASRRMRPNAVTDQRRTPPLPTTGALLLLQHHHRDHARDLLGGAQHRRGAAGGHRVKGSSEGLERAAAAAAEGGSSRHSLWVRICALGFERKGRLWLTDRGGLKLWNCSAFTGCVAETVKKTVPQQFRSSYLAHPNGV